MKTIVDADATPGIDIIEKVCKNYNIPCILVCDDTHLLESNYSEVVTVSKGFQSVDMYLLNHLEKNDIVITQDYGVAVLALSYSCCVLNPKGYFYTKENIDHLLSQRHLNGKLRRVGIHTKGNKKRTKEDDKRLEENFKRIILKTL